jgi:hypothetical protein
MASTIKQQVLRMTSGPSAAKAPLSGTWPAPKPKAAFGKAGKPKPDSGREWFNLLIMEAAASGKVDSIKFALDRGADVNARDALQRTPLMRACFHQRGKAMDFLIANGADITAHDVDGRTAKDMANIARSYKRDISVQ